MNINEKIANYRKQNGLTQESLASYCSVTRQAVAKWEKGESMPDIYTIARLARLFSVSIEDLIHTDNAVVENQNYYIRSLQKGDEASLCSLMYEHGVLGLTFRKLNELSESDGPKQGDQTIIEEYFSDPSHIFLLFGRNVSQALGIFDLREIAKAKSEMSAYIRNGFELDESLFIDFFSWVKTEYKVRATTVSVWGGQEERLFSSLDFNPSDGICTIALPLI